MAKTKMSLLKNKEFISNSRNMDWVPDIFSIGDLLWNWTPPQYTPYLPITH